MNWTRKRLCMKDHLDALYNNDFGLFIEYNRQDTALLAKLEKKLKFIELANEIAHQNTVLLQTTMGAVAVTEQAIVNEAHRRGMIVPGRVNEHEGEMYKRRVLMWPLPRPDCTIGSAVAISIHCIQV
jgi:DNA polymerase elongation subunit (family B)